MKLYELTQQKTLHVPIAPSGAGKTTLYNKLKQQHPNLESFSLDLLRHEFYDADDYANAFKMSTEDSEFRNRANQRFVEMLKTGQDIYVDNTNLTPKTRRFYLQQAKRAGYTTIAYVFDVPVEELIARQTTRPDKNVPEDAVRRQHASMKHPETGEFDEVQYV